MPRDVEITSGDLTSARGLLANRAAGRGLCGLEFAVAIPASLGGAVRMNAGAHNSSLADVLDWVRLYRLGEAAPAVLPAAKLGMRCRSLQ